MATERRRIIADLVTQHGRAEVTELSALLGVSRMTVRRDLNTLTSSGAIERAWGGAVVQNIMLSTETPYALKRRENEEVKRRIGQQAARLVGDGDVVILDAGSTTFHVATQLRGKRDVTVVTNDLKIAVELASFHSLTVITAGGVLQHDSFTQLSPQTEEFFRGIHVNWAFLGADAVDLNHGVSTRTLQAVAVKQAMIEAATEAILLVDHSKFDRHAFVRFCRIDDLTALITDRATPDDTLALLGDRLRVEVV